MDKVRFASAFTCCFVCKKACQDKCADCTVTRYCSRAHQLQDWPRHKVFCGWLRKELARRAALKAEAQRKQGKGKGEKNQE